MTTNTANDPRAATTDERARGIPTHRNRNERAITAATEPKSHPYIASYVVVPRMARSGKISSRVAINAAQNWRAVGSTVCVATDRWTVPDASGAGGVDDVGSVAMSVLSSGVTGAHSDLPLTTGRSSRVHHRGPCRDVSPGSRRGSLREKPIALMCGASYGLG